jgi:RNA polymerase sigma factor for flagellar operon FliA
MVRRPTGEVVMSGWSGEYPRDLAKVIGHAKRFTKVLTKLESASAEVWFLGRAGELRGVVSLALADWRSGASNAEAAGHAIVSYIDTLHQGVARNLRCAVALDCCEHDEVITDGLPDDWQFPPTVEIESTDPASATNGPTVPARWVDSPAVLARVREGLPLVNRIARAVARRVGEAYATLDDLGAFGREGLLDAARAFDDQRGVPFDGWASLRIRNAMIDGVRRWGPIPARERRRLQQRSGVAPSDSSPGARASSEPQATHDSSDSSCTAAAAGLAIGVGEGSGGLGATPEDLLAKAQIAALVREIVSDLPDRERLLIERTYFEGLPVEQAAASIGVSRSWAHRVHARAIDAIERELRKRDRMPNAGGSAWAPKRA